MHAELCCTPIHWLHMLIVIYSNGDDNVIIIAAINTYRHPKVARISQERGWGMEEGKGEFE